MLIPDEGEKVEGMNRLTLRISTNSDNELIVLQIEVLIPSRCCA
jgi:hypothetical protein